jgi:hypothetical protein
MQLHKVPGLLKQFRGKEPQLCSAIQKKYAAAAGGGAAGTGGALGAVPNPLAMKPTAPDRPFAASAAEPQPPPPQGREVATEWNLKVGSAVQRGPDWEVHFGDQDGGPRGVGVVRAVRRRVGQHEGLGPLAVDLPPLCALVEWGAAGAAAQQQQQQQQQQPKKRLSLYAIGLEGRYHLSLVLDLGRAAAMQLAHGRSKGGGAPKGKAGVAVKRALAASAAMTPEAAEAVLRMLYQAHDPSKLGSIPMLLQHYQGQEGKLVAAVRAAYR